MGVETGLPNNNIGPIYPYPICEVSIKALKLLLLSSSISPSYLISALQR